VQQSVTGTGGDKSGRKQQVAIGEQGGEKVIY
jgi:hypothetical protein